MIFPGYISCRRVFQAEITLTQEWNIVLHTIIESHVNATISRPPVTCSIASWRHDPPLFVLRHVRGGGIKRHSSLAHSAALYIVNSVSALSALCTKTLVQVL